MRVTNYLLLAIYSFNILLICLCITNYRNKLNVGDYKVSRSIMMDCDTLTQRETLLKFYEATNDSIDWIIPWNTQTPMEEWEGLCFQDINVDCDDGSGCDIACVSLSSVACVIGIDLDGHWPSNPISSCCLMEPLNGTGTLDTFTGNGLIGNMSDTLLLPELRIFTVSSNNLSGPVPDFYGIENLQDLGLHVNQFESIPDFSHLPALKRVQIFNNPICYVPNFSNMPALELINAHECEIKGELPLFDQWNTLEDLILYDNELEGVVPGYINHPELEILLLYKNLFTFEDFLPNFDTLCRVDDLGISPQKNIYVDTLIQIPEGYCYTLDLMVDDTVQSNLYHWYKDGDSITTTFDNELVFDSITLNDGGIYRCSVANFIVTPKTGLILASHPIELEVCSPGVLEIRETLCSGEEYSYNGMVFNEDTPSGKIVKDIPASNGCDSIVDINLTYLSAFAGNDTLVCESSFLFNANQSDNGEWTSTSSAMIGNLSDPQSIVDNLEEGINEFTWTVYNDNFIVCQEDTILIEYQSIPMVNDDLYEVNLGETINGNFLDNDLYNQQHHNIQIITSPIIDGLELVSPFNGDFTFVPPFNSLQPLFLQYEICNNQCPEGPVCEEGTITFQIDTNVEFPDVITPNEDGFNDEFKIRTLEKDLNALPDNRLVVFNINSEVVFEDAPYKNNWGGQYKGALLPQATYYYVFFYGDGRSKRGRLALISSRK